MFPSYRLLDVCVVVRRFQPHHVVAGVATGKRDFDQLASFECVFRPVDQGFCSAASHSAGWTARNGLAAGSGWAYLGADWGNGGRRVILIEHGPDGEPALFDRPREVILAWAPAEVRPALERAEAARAAGAWVAGYVAYEAGYALEPKAAPVDAAAAVGAAAGAGGVRRASGRRAGAGGRPGRADDLDDRTRALIGRRAYGNAARRVFDYIAAGDCYQVNLTFPMRRGLHEGTALGLYGAFRRTGAVGHGAFVDLGVGPVVVSRSPELFFRLEGGRIVTRPMKGTRPAGGMRRRMRRSSPNLQGAEKDRAENLMIVDLLRNDISRLSRVGIGARFPSFRDRNLCDGAPDDLDGGRGAWRPADAAGADGGAVSLRLGHGRAEDPGDGDHPRGRTRAARGLLRRGGLDVAGGGGFLVAIRTLSVSGRRHRDERGRRVTHGSTVAGEWEEALWKARFVKAAVSRG
jgi:para-aminobenzoate synthetase component 1